MSEAAVPLTGWANRLAAFSKRHVTLTCVAGGVVFIAFVVMASLYANMLVYDLWTLPNGQATGLGLTVHESITKTLVQYDGSHYTLLAAHGYSNSTDAAFLPLYPLLIRGAHLIVPSYDWSALLVSWTALLAAVVVLYRWVIFELQERKQAISGWLVLGLVAIFPTAFYLALPYTESLFLLLNIGALLAYRKGNYWLATVLAGLVAATRYQGLVLIVFFVIDYWLSKKRDLRKLLPVLGIVVGFGLYMLFLKAHYGSAFAFLDAEKSWGRLHSNVISNLVHSFTPVYVWFFAVLAAGLWAIYRKLGLAYFIYGLAFMILPLTSGRLDSMNRYMLSLTPLFLALALVSSQTPKLVRLGYICSAAFLAAWSIMLFANGYWVA